MDQQIQEPIKEVLSNYRFNTNEIRNESYKGKKGVWFLNTSNGGKILKKLSNSEATVKFLLAGVKYLTNNGIKIPKIEKTRDAKDYTKIGETCYVVSEWIQGTKLKCNSIEELELIASELGKFHKASKGFSLPIDSKPKNHLGTWIEEYSRYLENMNRFYMNELKQKSDNPIGKLVTNEFPYFYERGKKAIEGLKGREYEKWVSKVNMQNCLCHQDFSPANLLLSGNSLYVIDTDSITIDLPARDIRKLLNKIMKKTARWDSNRVLRIMSAYNSENKLLPAEWEVVFLDLMFPHLFLGAMDKYYNMRDKTWTETDYFNRLNEMMKFEKTITPLLQNFNRIIDELDKN